MEHLRLRAVSGGGDPIVDPLETRRQLASSVRVLRSRARISQEALGIEAGVSRNYVGMIERGAANPTFHVLVTLVAALDVPLGDLVAEFERERKEARGDV